LMIPRKLVTALLKILKQSIRLRKRRKKLRSKLPPRNK